MDSAPIIMRLGSYGLRKLMAEDANAKYLKWISDPEVNAYLTVGKFPCTLEDLSQYVARFDSSTTGVAFAIVHHQDRDKHVGNVTLNAINWISGTADIGLMIGDKKHARPECAHAVLSLIIPYAFDVLGLRRLYMGILEGNIACLEGARRLNMVEEGRWREHSLVYGEYQDELWFGSIKSQRDSLSFWREP
ncbi:MAG: GNAT family N-acetyltransferase [Desulfatibacillum sp.]|nr:GNAT family N-acetyltransferase [Desulfatibacillum sp.]